MINMFLKKKKRIMDTINSVCEVIPYIYESKQNNLLEEVEIAVKAILEQVEQEDYDIKDTINFINNTLVLIEKAKSLGDNVDFDDLNEILEQVSIFEQAFLLQVNVKLNVVFMPYNVTMWDSLESIYLACKEDEDCVARVVPIPFFDISQDVPVKHYHFDRFDKSLNLVDFREFDLVKEEPDIIYIHNIYDDGNILTTVHPDYYTEKLKKYTDMLVFSPYATPNFLKHYAEMTLSRSYTFNGCGADNIDRFVSAGDFVLKEGLQFEFERERILNLGCPKFDSLIHNIKNDFEYPEKWIKNKDKRIVVLATSIGYFISKLDKDADRFTNALNVAQEFTRILTTFKENDIFVIWRPHPLTRTFITRVNPEFGVWYDTLCRDIEDENSQFANQYSNVSLDTNESYLPAFKISDALMTNGSSIVYSYLMLNKQLLLLGTSEPYKILKIKTDENKIKFLIDDGDYYLEKMLDFEKRGETEIDASFMGQFYKNLDGNIGKKVHNAVKNDTLNK